MLYCYTIHQGKLTFCIRCAILPDYKNIYDNYYIATTIYKIKNCKNKYIGTNCDTFYLKYSA